MQHVETLDLLSGMEEARNQRVQTPDRRRFAQGDICPKSSGATIAHAPRLPFTASTMEWTERAPIDATFSCSVVASKYGFWASDSGPCCQKAIEQNTRADLRCCRFTPSIFHHSDAGRIADFVSRTETQLTCVV